MRKFLSPLIIISITVFLGWYRSFPRMVSIAHTERNSFFYEYHIDTSGFSGPVILLSNNQEITFIWEKQVKDSSAVQFSVKVSPKRFSSSVLDWAGSDSAWNKLDKEGWNAFKAKGWR